MKYKLQGTSQVQFLNTRLRGNGTTINVTEAAEYGIKNLYRCVHDLRSAGLRVSRVARSTYKISARDINGSRAKISA